MFSNWPFTWCSSLSFHLSKKKSPLKAWIITRIYIICLAIFKGCQVLQKHTYRERIFHGNDATARQDTPYTPIKLRLNSMLCHIRKFILLFPFEKKTLFYVIFHLRTWTNKRKIILHSFLYSLVEKIIFFGQNFLKNHHHPFMVRNGFFVAALYRWGEWKMDWFGYDVMQYY